MAHNYIGSEPADNAASFISDAERDVMDFALKASGVGLWRWNLKTGELYVSDRFIELLQASKAEFNYEITELKNRIHPDDYKRIKTIVEGHILQHTFFEIEFRLRKDDKSYLWVNLDGRTFYDGQSEPAYMGGSVVDATEYVKLKNQLERGQRELRLIFDNVPARIWFKDAHNKIVRLNEMAAKSMNLSVEEAEGANTYDLFPSLAKKYHEDDLDVINSGNPKEGIIEEYVPATGPHGWVRTDKVPYTDYDTGEKYVLVVSTDITQQKEYETKILENEARLKQANRDLDHFAYVASHDLKAPLRGMDNVAQWIAEDLGDSLTPDIQHKLDLLRGRVSRMEALLKDILAFSRAGKNIAEPEDIDMVGMIDEITQWLSPLNGFKIVKDTTLPTIKAPRSAIEHIFLNLMSNAIKHHDKAKGSVHIGCRDNGEIYELYVSDDGPGIAKKYQDHVFQIFKKLKRRDEVEGSGIGLAIVKKMVETIGGKVWISSENGKRGTIFHVNIPKSPKTLKP